MKHDHNTKGVTYYEDPDVVEYYNDPNVVEYYKQRDHYAPVEAALLARLKEELQNQPILEIGIGGGRTTPYLRQISKVYTGIDISEAMIQAARSKFPGVDLLTCDARDLSRFQNGQFAAVFFFDAGIDNVSAADRLLVVKEISRVLRSRGVLVLVGHNLELHWTALVGLRLYSNQRVFVADNLLRLRSWISHCKGALWNIIHDKGYAVIQIYEERFVDGPEIGAVIRTLYIRRSAQVRQLIENGFSEVEVFDLDGNIINDDKAAKVPRSIFLHFVARKQE
jgi:ubiquinone/menaquinone biosynthesis C-methylase UbiE